MVNKLGLSIVFYLYFISFSTITHTEIETNGFDYLHWTGKSPTAKSLYGEISKAKSPREFSMNKTKEKDG